MHDSMKRLHEISGITRKNVIAKQLGVTPATVTNWAARGVSKEGALAAAELYNTDANYILDGDESRKAVAVKDLSSQFKEFKEKHLAGKPKTELPILKSVAVTNYADIRNDNPHICDWVRRSEHLSSAAFGFLVLGRSMNPEFRAGDIAIIDVDITNDDLQDGDYVLVQLKTDDSASLRQVIVGSNANDIYLKQTNEDIPAGNTLPLNDFYLLGIVDHKITKYR